MKRTGAAGSFEPLRSRTDRQRPALHKDRPRAVLLLARRAPQQAHLDCPETLVVREIERSFPESLHGLPAAAERARERGT